MASAPSPTKRLKQLLKRLPNEAHIRGLLRLLQNRHLGSDYAVAIIGFALIERALEASISSRFITLDPERHAKLFTYEQHGPLADLNSRILIGRALGIFGPVTEADLHLIRNIRNVFAHSSSLMGFDQDEVVEGCRHLQLTQGTATSQLELAQNTPKGRYISACLEISARMRKQIEKLGQNLLAKVSPWRTFPVMDDSLP